MAKKKMIPDEVREQVKAVVEKFNQEEFQDGSIQFVPRFQGAYLYLNRSDYGDEPEQMCRLKYTGDFENWEFAIFKYSDMRYDPDEFFFPGSEHVDGTIEGAMYAALEAYPD